MSRRYVFLRAIVALVIGGMLACFATIQAASYSLASDAAVPGTLPKRVPASFGLRVYRTLDRLSPAPFVEATLAARALADGDAGAAQHYALRLPASPARDELLARVALARGDRPHALEYFLAAPDVDEVQRAAYDAAAASPEAGYRIEAQLVERLKLLTTHPDALAEAYWNLGQLAVHTAWVQVSGTPVQNAWLHRGLDHYEAAAALAPLSEKYAISAANQADFVGDRERAAALFARAADVDPGSADAIAGLGVVAFERGDAAAARAYLARARAIDPNSLMVRSLERDLRE